MSDQKVEKNISISFREISRIIDLAETHLVADATPSIQLTPYNTSGTNYWVFPPLNWHFEPLLIFLLNLLVPIPGMGYVGLGQGKKGLTLIIYTTMLQIIAIPMMICCGAGLLVMLFALVLRLMSAIDGYDIAIRAKNQIPIMEGECSVDVMAKVFAFKLPIIGSCTNALGNSPAFLNSDEKTAPEEWKSKMKALAQLRSQPTVTV